MHIATTATMTRPCSAALREAEAKESPSSAHMLANAGRRPLVEQWGDLWQVSISLALSIMQGEYFGFGI